MTRLSIYNIGNDYPQYTRESKSRLTPEPVPPEPIPPGPEPEPLPPYPEEEGELCTGISVQRNSDGKWVATFNYEDGTTVIDIKEDVTVDHFENARVFTSVNILATTALPFDIPADEVVGVKFYSIAGVTRTGTSFQTITEDELVPVDYIKAYTPYIIKVLSLDGMQFINDHPIVLKKTPIEVNNVNIPVNGNPDDCMIFTMFLERTVFGEIPDYGTYNYYGFVKSNVIIDGKEFTAGQFVKGGPRAYTFAGGCVLKYIMP